VHLVLLSAGYETNLAVPHNVYGWNGLEALQQWAEESGANAKGVAAWLHLGKVGLETAARHTTKEDWDPAKWANVPEPTVVIFLALHGGADSKGAYLFLDAEPGLDQEAFEKNRLRLDYLFDKLDELTKSRQVVLILDATQIADHWPSGMLFND